MYHDMTWLSHFYIVGVASGGSVTPHVGIARCDWLSPKIKINVNDV